MRTRRIAIGCRRAGRGASVAVGPGEVTTHPELGLPELDPSWPSVPRDLGGLVSSTGVEPAAPGGTSARPDARDGLDWNHNPGWPQDLGWAGIAQSAGGRPHRTPQPLLSGRSPRHARHPVLVRARLAIPDRAVAWTGMGIGVAVILTVVADAVADLIR